MEAFSMETRMTTLSLSQAPPLPTHQPQLRTYLQLQLGFHWILVHLDSFRVLMTKSRLTMISLQSDLLLHRRNPACNLHRQLRLHLHGPRIRKERAGWVNLVKDHLEEEEREGVAEVEEILGILKANDVLRIRQVTAKTHTTAQTLFLITCREL